MVKILLLIFLTLLCAWLIALGFRKPERMIKYPFLAVAVFGGWVLPQLIGLSFNPWLPHGAIEKTIFMTLLCVLAIQFGNAANKAPLQLWNWSFNRKRFVTAASVLSLSGAYFYYRVSMVMETAPTIPGGGVTGIITIYFFLASMLTFGLVLALVAHLNKPSRWTMSIILFDLLFYIDRILLQGRRQAAVELFVFLGLFIWFKHRKLPPRWVFGAALIVGALWVNSVGHYRAAIIGQETVDLQGALQIDYVDNFKQILTRGGKELTNAVYDIEAADRLNNFDFGLSHWNGFVRAYIPGQIIGHSVKQNLMVDLGDAAYLKFYHVPHSGSTHTGMSDAFASFWYFGAFKFFFIAFVMAKLFSAANRGHIVAQMLLMLVFVGGLESITHSTDRFFMIWPKVATFLLPALWYARSRVRHPMQHRSYSSAVGLPHLSHTRFGR